MSRFRPLAAVLAAFAACAVTTVQAQQPVLNIYSARHYQTDEALYAAKHGGRNRAVIGTPVSPAGQNAPVQAEKA